MKLSEIKLMTDEEIQKSFEESGKTNKGKVQADISPVRVNYLFEKDEETGEFISEGGYSEKISNSGENVYGIMDKESEIGIEMPSGAVVDYATDSDNITYSVHNRNTATNANALVEVSNNGGSIRIREKINGELYEFCFIRDANGDIVACGDNIGIPMVDEGRRKFFVYSYYELSEHKEKKQFFPLGNSVMYQSDYPLAVYHHKGTRQLYWTVDVDKPYYFYTADNKKYLKEPNKQSVLVESGVTVKAIIDKVKAVAHKKLEDLGLDNYDRETKTYYQPQIKEKKGILSRFKKSDREA